MKEYLILENNKVNNIVKGLPSPLKDTYTALEYTGSTALGNVSDYYLTSSNTFYSPLFFNSSISPNHDLSGNGEYMIDNGTYTLTIQYNDTIQAASADCITFPIDDITISNFTTFSRGFTFDITPKDSITGSSEHSISLVVYGHGIKDSNNNQVSSPSVGTEINIEYTGSSLS